MNFAMSKVTKEINVGIIGFGVVGSGTAKVLIDNKSEIEKKTGIKINLKKIADLDIESDRGVKIEKSILTKDVDSLLDDSEIDVVVETIGGIEPAKKFILKALENGKHVVTANKKLLAEEGEEIISKANEKKLLILFEAAVGGAIPIIRTIKTSFASEKITEIRGILNGTSNYILTKLKDGNMSFKEALKIAQEKGYAEADPTLDINGMDAAHKISLVSKMVFGVNFNLENALVEGIEKLEAEDFLLAEKLGFEIKLLAISKFSNNSLFTCVYPAFLSKESDLAQISGVKNAITFFGDNFGEISLCGAGAGSLPTGTAIASDIVAAARYVAYERTKRLPIMNFSPNNFREVELENISNRVGEYYIRLSFPDVAGVFARVASILAKKNISIASLIQTEDSEYGKIAKAAMVLHDCREKDFIEAKEEIDALDFMEEESFFLRIER